MNPKLLLCLALVLSGGLLGCSSIHPTSAKQTTAPLYVHFGFDLGQGVKRSLSMRIHPGESIFVGGDDYLELKGTIDRRGTNLVADLTGSNGQESGFYRGSITPEKPFFAQRGAASGGAGLCWFVVSTNSDGMEIAQRVSAVLGLTNAPVNAPDAALQSSITNASNQVDPTTGLPVDPATGLPMPSPLDIRSVLLLSAERNQPDFPNGRNTVLTHFSHIGQLAGPRGEIIYVVDERAVTTDALAPHGRNFIVFFDMNFQFLGKINYVNSRPLWCDGSKLYLFGDLDGTPEPGSNYSRGNVIDVSDGFANLKIYHAKVYGSSGGLEDN